MSLRIQAPVLHGNLSLSQRCELGLCGFLVLDLWALQGMAREKKLRLKKGSSQLAPQTRTHLQSCGLGVAALASSSVMGQWCPFLKDQVLSESHIEHLFGQLRASSSSGSLTAKSYFSAQARMMRAQMQRHASYKEHRDKGATSVEVLAPEEFRRCARRAWVSAMQLVKAGEHVVKPLDAQRRSPMRQQRHGQSFLAQSGILLEHELKQIRIAEADAADGQRASRLAKWMAVTQEERTASGLDEPRAIQRLAWDCWMFGVK
eukprot:Skav218861  [mRNA]  locus=scaffold2417:89791:93472:+ [translate_table: standard]